MASTKSSPRIKWPITSPETHLLPPYPQNPTASIDSQHEQKDIENDKNQQSIAQEILNDENIDNNTPFHLSHHHLKENNKKIERQEISDASSPQTTLRSSTTSVQSSNNNDNYHHHQNMHMHMQSHMMPNPHGYHGNLIHSHHRSRTNINDKLQRKLQKLEQDILSKNIQHDIMVNKEEMMGKRLKTKDVRIKNLQNDINKLRDQLTAKNESQDVLVNEMSELQAQNRGLASKLRESNTSMTMSEANNYNESMRDMLVNISNEINQLKQQKQQHSSNQSNQLIKDVVESMKEQEREFMNQLKKGQSEWMNNISLQINDNDKNNKNEMINIFCNKLDEMEKNNKAKLNNMHQNIKKQEIKLDSLNTNYFQTFFDGNNKLMNQKQQILINELKQDMKREIYSTQTELISKIKKTKNEIGLNINKLSNDIKYQIPIKNNNSNDINNINNNILSDIMNENALKITNLEESINKLCKNNKNTIKCIQERISSQNNNFKQISDENTSKTINAIVSLKPLFDKLYDYFQKTDNNIIQSIQQNNNSIQQNNNGMTQSFAQFKHDFTKIIESINTNKEYSSLLKEMKTINTYFSNIKENKHSHASEFNSISKHMQKMTRRHDEIVQILTNSLPNANTIETMNNKTRNNNNKKPSPQKHVYNGAVNEETVKIIKSMIISQIEEMKKSFNSADNNLTIKFDTLLQEINSRNISLFKNIKQINDAQQKYILKESDLNNTQLIKTHESVLKNHLQQIQLRLSQLNKTQITLNKAVTSRSVTESNEHNKMETMINNLNNNLSEMFEKNGIKKTTKDVQLYIRNDMMKEMQLIKNLCNDIHKKSQQLPHFVARNKDLKKFEQMFEDFTQNSNKPIQNIKNNRLGSILMISLKEWCENILSQISYNRNNCSVYVVLYILSQIVFNTFLHPNNNDNDNDHDDIKEKEKEENGEDNDMLSQIQLRGLSQLDNIYNNMENDEFDSEIIIENFFEWMQTILNNENISNLWITRTGHAMRHFCQKEFAMNKKLINIKNKINQIIQKQSKTCWRMSIFQPLLLCAPIVVVLLGFWLNSITKQQNTYW